MKKLIFALTIAAMVLSFGCQNKSSNKNLKGTVKISGAFALYPMMQVWKEEFTKLYPEVKLDISAGGAGKGMTDVLQGQVQVAMVSREINDKEIEKGAWFIPVTKDAVVPIINENNPYIQKLMNTGVKKEVFEAIYVSEKISKWAEVTGDKTNNEKINIFTRSDACGAADVWAKFFGKKQEDLKGTGVSGDPGVTEAVKGDKYSIGYNNIGFAYDMATKLANPGIKVLPIDINGNGQIDDNENFYVHKDSLVKAIGDGRYPSPPSRDLYLVTKGKPTDVIVITFFKWILTEGQKYVPQAGYINLNDDKIKAATEHLDKK